MITYRRAVLAEGPEGEVPRHRRRHVRRRRLGGGRLRYSREGTEAREREDEGRADAEDARLR